MPSYLFHFTNLPLITHLSTTTSLTTSSSLLPTIFIFFFFFNDTAPTEIYPLPLHDALPIYRAFAIAAGFAAAASLLSLATARTRRRSSAASPGNQAPPARIPVADAARTSTLKGDRKSTRLNSSHDQISYAVFCLKKKKIKQESSTGFTPTVMRAWREQDCQATGNCTNGVGLRSMLLIQLRDTSMALQVATSSKP